MVEYVFLILALLCFGGQFAVSKLYQTKVKNSFITATMFSMIAGVFASILFAIICKGKIKFNLFSFIMAAGGILSVVLYTIVGMKMMSIGSVAMYTMIIMLGGMFIPFLYGVLFLDEEITIGKIIGIVFLILALVVPVIKSKDSENKNPKLFFALGVIVFIANGLVGVFNKTHQISPEAISTFEYGFLQSLISMTTLFLVISISLFIKNVRAGIKEDVSVSIKHWWIILLFAIISQSGEIFLLFAAKTIDASIMFPITTGGTMFVSAIFGLLFFKEKIDKVSIVGLVIAILSTIAFVF